MIDEIWNYLEEITSNFETPIDRNDEKTYKQLLELFPLHSMLIQHWSIGHAQFLWNLRQNKKVIKVFEKIWNDTDLITSFDGASIHMPPEITNRGWYLGNDWFHTDQSYTRNNFECIQSWITAYDVEEGDATLQVLEKSHKLHGKFAKKFNITNKSDWYKLSIDELEFYENCKKVRIECKAGSVVLWDSRMIHCGSEPKKSRKNPKFRMIGYICMVPRSLATETTLKKRKKAFEDLRTTNHYPHKVKLFPKTPRTYGKELPDIENITPPVLTKLGMKLI